MYRSGFLFLMVALFSCGIGEAQKSLSLVTEDFEKQMASEGERILLDVRTPGEFGERHLAGAKDSVVLLDFNAAWCAPCKKKKSFMPDLITDCRGKLKVIYVDYDSNPQLVSAMKVASVPALMLFQNGSEIKRYSGFVAQEDLKLAISPLLKP